MIELSDLRKLAAEGKTPISIHVENTSNFDANGKRNGPISRVVISVIGKNGKERVINIDATIATTDILDQASFEEIMDAPQFSNAIRKKLIRILSDAEAKEINTSDKAIKNLKNRAALRGTPAEETVVDGVGVITKMVTDWNAGALDEEAIVEKLTEDAITFTKADLTSAIILVADPSSDVFRAITEKLSDFEVG